jgi:hypothetical protein
MKLTASAVQLPDGSCTPNSPFHTSEFAMYEGSDGYEDVQTLGSDQVDQANDLIDNPVLDLGPILVPFHGPLEADITDRPMIEIKAKCLIEFNFGGDQAHSNSMNCLAGCNCSNPCPYCEASKHDMCSLDFDQTSTIRKRDRIILLAHAKLGMCPGCRREIVPKGTVKDQDLQVELAEEGDDEPVVPADMKLAATKGRPVTHTTVHLGVVLGRTPPYHLDPSRWIVCILHLNLCIVRGLFARTIVAEFGKLPTSTGEQKISLAQKIDAMAELLLTAGIRMKKSKITKNRSKEVSVYDERLKSSGMGGRDADFMLNARNAMMKLMFPVELCGPWHDDEVLFASKDSFNRFYAAATDQPNAKAIQKSYDVRRAWYQWDRTWSLLRSKLVYTAAVDTLPGDVIKQAWETRADAVFESAKVFVTCWIDAVGPTQGLYLHELVAHVPDQIRRFGDLGTRQTQGLEHCHARRKQVGFNATNRKEGQRLSTMMQHSTIKRKVMQDDEVDSQVNKEESSKAYRQVHSRTRLAKMQRHDNIVLKLETRP